MKRILLINSPWYDNTPLKHGIRSGCRWPWTWTHLESVESVGYLTFPFFLAYATSYLKDRQVATTVDLYDAIAYRDSEDVFYSKVRTFAPDLIVFETSTPSWNNDHPIIKQLKNISDICLVGPHVAPFAEKLIQLPEIDYVIKGEYEKNLEQIIRGGSRGVYEFDLIEDLDSVPLPYRDQRVLYRYSDHFVGGLDEPQVYVWTSRGCPFRCSFCVWQPTMYNYKVRFRSPEKVIEEVRMLVDQGAKSILLDDDTMNVGDKRTREIAEGMGKIGVQWAAMCRVDSCNWATFKLMRTHGCVALKMGVESFSQPVLDRIGKKINVDEMIETINVLHNQLGFKLFLSAIRYLPGETDEDRKVTQDILSGFEKKGIRFQYPFCTPFPGTKLYYDMVEKGYKLDDEKLFDAYDGGDHHDKHKQLTDMMIDFSTTDMGEIKGTLNRKELYEDR